MSEFIGSRISLISRSDIRYVGILHAINSEESTVSLEEVRSFGTEGRKGNPDEEIAPNDSVYEYVVFRGSDVKDLRIEDAPKKEENRAPAMPNDPAILGSGRPQGPGGPPNQPPYPPFNQYQQYQQQQQQQRFGNGPAGPYAFPGAPPPPPGNFGGPQFPYGGPPPPGGFQGPPPFPPGQFPPQQQQPHHHQQQQPPFGGPAPQQRGPQGPPGLQQPQQQPPSQAKPQPNKGAEKPASQPAAAAPATSAATAPGPDTKPSLAATAATEGSGKKANRVAPAMPLAGPAAKSVAKPPVSSAPAPTTGASAPAASANNTEAATAAVAAAMAKLQPNAVKPKSTNGGVGGMDNLTQKINNMRIDNQARGSGPGPRGRGGRRGGAAGGRPMDVPKDDFDFESANAKFNKQDLVKEAIGTGSPVTSPNGEGSNLDGTAPANGSSADVVIPAAAPIYNKSNSFFDNMSSEAKQKEEAKRPTGFEARNEERKRNIETFGVGSVESPYGRGGYRGRGRGRGFRGRGGGGGGFNRGRGRGESAVH